jgi:hypothetical protein
LELQRLADETGLTIAVSHFPPGTSKWNKIEHRLFSFISKNWRGQPLTSLKVIVNLIAGNDEEGAQGSRGHRRRQLSGGSQGSRLGDGSTPALSRCLSW